MAFTRAATDPPLLTTIRVNLTRHGIFGGLLHRDKSRLRASDLTIAGVEELADLGPIAGDQRSFVGTRSRS